MNELEPKKEQDLHAYKLGRACATIFLACLAAILVAGTIKLITWILF